MPNIKPISDLRNYTAVINEVAYGNRVYLTKKRTWTVCYYRYERT